MYLRLRKRKKPLQSESPSTTQPAPLAGAEEPAPSTSDDWIPADPAEGAQPGTDVGTTSHPNRGRAHESARGSHR